MTQAELGARLGVNQRPISRAVRGAKKERRGEEGFPELRVRITEHLSGSKMRGPVWIQE